jgi:hypothetical protein
VRIPLLVERAEQYQQERSTAVRHNRSEFLDHQPESPGSKSGETTPVEIAGKRSALPRAPIALPPQKSRARSSRSWLREYVV